MSFKKVVESLHQLEREILPVLASHSAVSEIATVTNLSETAVHRALKWLEKKGLTHTQDEQTQFVTLDTNGKRYQESGLPERNLLDALKKSELSIDQAKKATNLTNEEMNIAIGSLRKSNAIFITKDKKMKILDGGRKLLDREFPEERFLQKKFPLNYEDIKDKKLLDALRKRKNILKVDTVRSVTATLTDQGTALLASGVKISDTIDALTSTMLKTGSWRDKKFRRYDISSGVPRLFPGKKQHYRKFLDDVRIKFLSLGFKEMAGPIVETDFWNMDALFMPQFHSARDIHEAYYIKQPSHAQPLPKNVLAKVKKAHESGLDPDSKGWQYSFDTHKTHRHLLRTHDTAISARTLASENLSVPGKYFQIVRCFRYDVIDATHLPDFNQTGGFVVDENLNLRHLFGLLKLFAEEFAETDQIKITPSYFPFTEPSAELHAKHPDLGWIELAGSGIFRPEMCKALGVNQPVIAWGLGLERLAMFKLGIKDIRDLFSHNLETLRGAPLV